MRLPRTRSADCLIGIWVLNRGRLAPPPPPPPPPPQPLAVPTQAAPSSTALPPALASALASIMPSGAAPTVPPTQAAVAAALSHLPYPISTANATMAPAPQPGHPIGSLPPPPPQPPLLGGAPQPLMSAADLAAQVAALSPEQIQAMLLTLQLQQQPPSQPQQPPSQPPAPLHAPAPPQPHWPGMPEPPREAYGGFEYDYEHDERERDRGRDRDRGGGPRRGGYYPRDDVPRARGRGGRRGAPGASGGAGVGTGAGAGGWEDGRAAGWEREHRRTSDGGWASRGRGAPPGSGSPVRRDAPAYWR